MGRSTDGEEMQYPPDRDGIVDAIPIGGIAKE